ncbi:MAG TPA: alpha/beta fold hydrolase [Candidatus Binataceae bacterium]|nr:alpha/beta fold hydrolase [Candidatus Binataceae bacterium]
MAAGTFAQSKDGTRIHYEIRGQGAPLALIFGYAGSSRGWGEPFLKLLEARFKTIVIDNRGTGQSDKPEKPFSMAEMAADAASVLDHANIDRAHVMGISMGGMIAQEFALNHPARLRGLVLGCTMCGLAHSVPGDPETLAALQLKPSEPLAAQVERLLAACCAKPFLASAKGQAVLKERVAEVMNYAITPPHTYQLHWGAVGGFDTFDRLPQIKAPTLVITGTSDLLVPDANSDIIKQRIPGARIHKLQGAGHVFFWEAPEDTAAVVTKFLAPIN